jgi:hemoglobin/transferrin/lactoferrin receptor protein
MQYQMGAIRLEVTGFYTLFRNAIILAPFQLNGQDSVLYNGIKAQVIANQNARKAFVRGFQYKSVVTLNQNLTWETTVSQTYGRFITNNGIKKPLDHVPPLFGRSSILYQKDALDWEFFVHFNGWKRIKDYNRDGEDNAQYATPDGTPAWYTLNLRVGYRLDKSLQLQAGLENMLDRNYRYFASGFSAPGRNVYLTVRVNF